MTLRVCLLGAAGAFAFTAAAAAQTPQRWTQRDGLWSVDLGSAWSYSDGLQPTADVTMMFTPTEKAGERTTHGCLARWDFFPPIPMNGDVRKRGGKVDLVEAAKILAPFGQMPSKVEHRDVDGVAVAYVESSSGTLLSRWFVFFTPGSEVTLGPVLMTTMQCMWNKGLPAARLAEIDTLLNSLRIRNVDAKP